ncbi:hypothetical protein AAG906_001715 [Vitis piasezkii]
MVPPSPPPPARIDRIEQRMRLLHVSNGVMSWDGCDDFPVVVLPIEFHMLDIERYTGIGYPPPSLLGISWVFLKLILAHWYKPSMASRTFHHQYRAPLPPSRPHQDTEQIFIVPTTKGQHVPPMTPFILFPEGYGGRVAQPLPIDRPFVGAATREELQRENNEIFHPPTYFSTTLGFMRLAPYHLPFTKSDDDLHLTGFTFDEVQVVSLEDDSRGMVPMSFDQYNNTLVLSMMRDMSYLPGLGLGYR